MIAPTKPVEQVSLRERALAVVREEQRKREEAGQAQIAGRLREQRETLSEQLFAQLEIDLPSRDILGPIVTVDGIRLGLSEEWGLCIFGPCPGCGQMTEQWSACNLETVGEWLNQGQPQHRCFDCIVKGRGKPAVATPEPTFAERLETLIREIVRDETGSNDF